MSEHRTNRRSDDAAGPIRPHHVYLFANGCANRMKAVVHVGIGVWLASRRLNAGNFAGPHGGAPLSLDRGQLDALTLDLPWKGLGEAGIITLL